MSEKTIKEKEVQKSFTRQQDQSDCGVACLLSIVKYYGGGAKIERLRELSGTTKQGTTVLGLFQAANELGLKAEAYEADIPDLIQQKEPCILHIIKDKKLQHYVVFYGTKGEDLIISDPAEGVKLVSKEELDKQWHSRALLLLKKTEAFVELNEVKSKKWSWIKELVREDMVILGLALALGIFITILSLSTAIYSQHLIDEILPTRDTYKLFLGAGLLVILLIGRSGLAYVRQLFILRQSRDFNNRIISSFYDSLLKLPIPFFQNRKTGDLIARMNDASRLQRTITFLFAEVMIDVLMIIVAGIYILSHSYLLGGFVLLCVPVYFVLTWHYNDSILTGQKMVMAAHSTNESNYVDTIQGVATIKVASKESFFSSLTKTVYGFFQDQIFTLGKVGIGFGLWANLIGVLFSVSVLIFSSMLVFSGEILIGALVAIFQMTSQLIPSANRLALTNIQIQEARVAFDRLYEFTSLESEYYGEEMNGPELSELNTLKAKRVTFRFPGRSPLLKGVDFEVGKGEMISLLGESGCGKTTILQILQKFYKPESGEIIINGGLELQKIPIKRWRLEIASVSQEVKIFNGTLLDNICLGIAQEETEKVVEFCREYGFDKYFESFPQQYATLLGEEGVNISGGQRQLVALARALYQKPKLLLLDEATSAMDRRTESKILSLLNSLKKEMAIILVTHRVQSARIADRIYIIEGGLVTDKGEPENLKEKENLFSFSLNDMQLH